MPYTLDLTGRRVAITGAGRGIGRASAIACAQAGADVALIARSEHELEALAEELRAAGHRAFVLPADVTHSREVAWAFQQIADAWGGLEGLVCNAGMNIRKPVEALTDNDWSTVLATNLTGAFHCCQAALPLMTAGAGIVLMGSVAGLTALPTGTAYAAAKAGLHQMARTLALELGPRGIRINALAPWYVTTDLTAPLLEQPEFVERVLSVTPLGRVGTVEDVAGAVVFLLSEAAGWISGQTLAVDGGMSVVGFR